MTHPGRDASNLGGGEGETGWTDTDFITYN